MTDNEKEHIEYLRSLGYSFAKIANILDLSVNTIKSHCRRNNKESSNNNIIKPSVCKKCGKIVLQNTGHKEKKFCCDDCRTKWWNEHRNQIKRKNTTTVICPVCNKTFESYTNNKRKYCSHECYISARFKRGNIDEK